MHCTSHPEIFSRADASIPVPTMQRQHSLCHCSLMPDVTAEGVLVRNAGGSRSVLPTHLNLL